MDNKCILTGKTRHEIQSKIYKATDYNDLLKHINTLSYIDNTTEFENMNILKTFIEIINNGFDNIK